MTEKRKTWTIDDVEVAGHVVNEEVMNGEVEGWAGAEADGDELDPEQVRVGRKEELEFMIVHEPYCRFSHPAAAFVIPLSHLRSISYFP